MKVRYLIGLVVSSICALHAEAQCHSHPELHFFNSIVGDLEIKISEAPKPMENLRGILVSPGEAELINVKLDPKIYIPELKDFRSLTEEELNSVTFKLPSIVLVGESGEPVTHYSTNNKYFTVRELLQAVEVTELKTRGNTEWFGGIDIHHVFFEGIHCEYGQWQIYWGS